ncbi:hypothetical protein BY458DRAFT_498627 [Sporodiniella umbellata]|nr:hypothetical protein BY458DRAFT_498627 [Sporodiniella umbellata]
MSSESNLKKQNETNESEEVILLSEGKSAAYGATQRSRFQQYSCYKPSPEDLSDHGSSEDRASVKIARRKKQRLQKHHKSSRPKLVSKLSHIVRSTAQSEEEDNTDDIIQMPPDDLILPELDQNAAEVREYVYSPTKNLETRIRKHKVNLSTIREKYRETRLYERNGNQPLTKGEQLKKKLKYDSRLSKLKTMLFGNTSIVLFVYTDLIVDVLFCLSYLVEMKHEAGIITEPFWMYKWRPYDLWMLCVVLSMWNFGSFLMRIVLTGRPISVLFSFRSFIELLTTAPFLTSIFIRHGQFLYVPYFLRSWVLLLRMKSAMKIKMNLLMSGKPIDALKSKLVHLVGTIVVLLYNGLSAFQYCEVTFGNTNYSILESLYVVMVTLSTVGYGDITPQTEGSRVVMMLLIVISLAVLPSLIADALSTLRKRNDWGGYVSDSSTPFILIVGSFRAEQVTDILDGFLNKENTEPHLNVIFLDINKPNEELKFLERNSMWGHRIQFIHGSELDEKTLLRVQARSASAIFTLSDEHASNFQKEDERNTVRLWSLYCHTVVHNVDIYSYNLSPYTAVYQKMAKEIICVREFKQYLIAMSCRCRGASTLLTNLLHQRKPMDHYDESWQAQYDDGSCNEIYMDQPPLALIGLTFKEAAWIVYIECQVILFGVKAHLEGQSHREMLLNPENNYVIKSNDLCVYMCESPRELNDVNDLTVGLVREKIKKKMTERSTYKTKVPQTSDSISSGQSGSTSSIVLSREPSLVITNSTDKTNSLNNNDSLQNGLQNPAQSVRRTRSEGSNQTVASQKGFRLAKLPTPRMALLTGNRRIVRHLDELPLLEFHDIEHEVSPVCYLLHEQKDLSGMTIENAENMSGHVVVCMHQKVSNIFKFIFNLRSPQLKPEELQDIVFLCTSKPTDAIVQSVCQFPKVFFMLGNCQHPEDLVKAGVRRAKQIVVMSESECLDLHERTSDSPAVMTSHLLDLLLHNRPHGSSCIVNLVEKSNIRFMHLLQGKDVAEEIDVFYTPAYAAGNVVVDSLLSNVLLSQTYYKPDIVSVIKALCGMPGPLYNNETISSTSNPKSQLYLFKNSRHLMLVELPRIFVHKTFSMLFENLILGHEALALGLLRGRDENMGNDLSFVYTNPVPSLVLKKTDQIYILASPGWSFSS